MQETTLVEQDQPVPAILSPVPAPAPTMTLCSYGIKLTREELEGDQPSCSAVEALTRQEPFINQNLAYQALGMLTQLLRHGSVSYQGGFGNLATGQVAPLLIRAVPAHA